MYRSCLVRATATGPGTPPTSVELPYVMAGQTFLLQFHEGFGPGVRDGIIQIGHYVDPCGSMPDDFLEENDTCLEAQPIRDGSIDGLHVSIFDKDLYSFCVPPGGTVTVGTLIEVTPVLWDANSVDCGLGPSRTLSRQRPPSVGSSSTPIS